MSIEDPEAFGLRARSWLLEHATMRPEDEADRKGSEIPLAEQSAFQAALYDAGFAGITCPKEYGGQGLTTAHQLAFSATARNFSLPNQVYIIGVLYMVPSLLDCGSEQQKKRYIPKLLRGEEIWCMLFSEPGAGSDLASLQTRATREGPLWRISGQKVWSSDAQHSDYGAVITRTDPDAPKHKGITVFVINMRDPGVTVRPLRVATGATPFNEVFLDSVPASDDDLIGSINEGWKVGVVMLRHEREAISSLPRPRSGPLSFESLRDFLLQSDGSVGSAIAQRLGELYSRQRCVQLLGSLLREEAAASPNAVASGSVGKLAGSELSRLSVDVALDVLGANAAGQDSAEGSVIITAILNAPSSSIAGGTNEIQRNIIGERVLGLAKDPGVDRETPFSHLRVGTLERR